MKKVFGLFKRKGEAPQDQPKTLPTPAEVSVRERQGEADINGIIPVQHENISPNTETGANWNELAGDAVEICNSEALAQVSQPKIGKQALASAPAPAAEKAAPESIPLEFRKLSLTNVNIKANIGTEGEAKWENDASDGVFLPEGTDRSCLNCIPLTNFSWFMGGAQWITEGRTFYMVTEQGEFIFIQVVYAASGWHSTIQATVRYCDTRKADAADKEAGMPWTTTPLNVKDGEDGMRKHHFECVNFSVSKTHTSKSKTSIGVGSDISMELMGFGPEHSLEEGKGTASDSDEKGFRIKYKSRVISLDLFFKVFSQMAICLGDGSIYFGADKSDGSINLRFLPFGKVTGSLVMDGKTISIKARSFCVHLFQGMRPNLVASCWKMGAFLPNHPLPDNCTSGDSKRGVNPRSDGNGSDGDNDNGSPCLFMIQMNTPPSYGNAVVNISYVFSDDRLLAISRSSSIDQLSPSLDKCSGYYIPTDFRFSWKGYTMEGVPLTAGCSIAPKTLVARINVLAQLPYVMRKVIETFITRPYVYQWLNPTTLEIQLGNDVYSCKGFLFQELSILNEET